MPPLGNVRQSKAQREPARPLVSSRFARCTNSSTKQQHVWNGYNYKLHSWFIKLSIARQLERRQFVEKFVTMATSLERSENERQTYHLLAYYYHRQLINNLIWRRSAKYSLL